MEKGDFTEEFKISDFFMRSVLLVLDTPVHTAVPPPLQCVAPPRCSPALPVVQAVIDWRGCVRCVTARGGQDAVAAG